MIALELFLLAVQELEIIYLDIHYSMKDTCNFKTQYNTLCNTHHYKTK